MSGPIHFDTDGAEGPEARRWLSALRTGSPDEKAQARRRLAEVFEARGMVSEAVELLLTNAREGHRDAELFQALARMYRQLGDEYLAASAALEATRLSGRQPASERADRQPASDRAGRQPAKHGPVDDPRQEKIGPRPAPQPAPRSADSARRAAPGRPAPWRLPLRVAGWITVLATVVAAAVVGSQSPVSGALYLASAAALGLLLVGSGAARTLVRLPDGPLGDGALLFLWLFALLAAGALLPRPLTTPGRSEQPTEAGTPGVVRTPSPSPSPASSGPGPAAPTSSPTP